MKSFLVSCKNECPLTDQIWLGFFFFLFHKAFSFDRYDYYLCATYSVYIAKYGVCDRQTVSIKIRLQPIK